MRRAAVGILGLVSIAGCTVTEKQYQSDYCDAMRGYREGPCSGYAEWALSSCDPQQRPMDSNDCAFDRENATHCLEQAWTCDSETGQIRLPDACTVVYACVDS